MKYFTINWSDNLEEMGFYPQLTLNKDYNPSSLYGHWNVEFNLFLNI